MIRKSIFALAAIAAVGTAVLATSSDAQAWGKKGWYPGKHIGKHFGHGHFGHGFGHRYGYGFGALALVAPDCYQVITRRGFVRTVCD